MKFVEFIKKHCFLVVTLVIILIILVAGIIVAKNFLFSSSGNAFGNRLDGIEEHEITSDNVDKIKSELEGLDQVVSVSDNIVGRRADFILTVKADVDVISAQGLADKILEFLEDDQKSYYDIQVMVVNEDAENQNYPIIGYKHKSKVGFSW